MTDPTPHLLALYRRGAIKSPALPGMRLTREPGVSMRVRDESPPRFVAGLFGSTWTLDTSDPVTVAALPLLLLELFSMDAFRPILVYVDTVDDDPEHGFAVYARYVGGRVDHLAERATVREALTAALAACVAVLENA